MLRFWQFTDNEMEDYLPEIYWTKDEMDFGDKIIDKYIQNDKKEFGCIMISERFGLFKFPTINIFLKPESFKIFNSDIIFPKLISLYS